MSDRWISFVPLGVVVLSWLTARSERGGLVRRIIWRTAILTVLGPCVLRAQGESRRASQPASRSVSTRPDTTRVDSGSMFIVSGDTLTAISAVGKMRILVRGDSAWRLEPGPKTRLTGAVEALYVKFVENKRNAADFERRRGRP